MAISPEDLKGAWSLIKSKYWEEGEEEAGLKISVAALKMVYNKMQKNPDCYGKVFNECGWKLLYLINSHDMNED